jgi:hypothetical protein
MDIEPQTVLAVAAVGALAYTCLNKKKEEPKPVPLGTTNPLLGGRKSRKSKPKRKSAKKSRKSKPKRKSVKKSRKSKPKRKSAKKSRKSKPKRKSAKKLRKSKPKRKSAKKPRKSRKEPLKKRANSKLGCVDLCKKGTASQQKKYCNRNSPPYPGAVCAELGFDKKKGNDGNMYYANKAGRWSKA